MNWNHLPPGTTATVRDRTDNKTFIVQVLAWAWDETTKSKNVLWYLSTSGFVWSGSSRAEIGVTELHYPQTGIKQ